jgi:ribulose-phosphate 3-epimerase
MGEVVPKVRRAREEVERLGLDLRIEVDGGINEHTIGEMAAAGADTFVAGSAIFGAQDPAGAARRIRSAAQAAVRG